MADLSASSAPASGFDPNILAHRAQPSAGLQLHKRGDIKSVDKAAQDFEAMFLSQMLSHMWEGVGVDETFGGGHGEEMFRSLMIEQQGKLMARAGGVGIARHVKEAMLHMQEVANGTAGAPGNVAAGSAAAGGLAAPSGDAVQ
jgi:Rod binding domain-containing protein